ncbi:RxLR effector family protein, partial [Phytophthora palmivora]
MIAKHRLTCFYGLLILVSALIALTCVGANSTATSSKTIGLKPRRILRARRHNSWSHRTNDTLENQDTSEERMIGVTSVTKVKDLVTSTQQNLKTLAANAKLKFATNKQKASDDLFRALKIGNVERRPLESKQFQQWTDSIAKTYKKDPEVGTTTMVSTLLSHYDDASVANMLAAAGKVTRTKDVAKSLEGGLFTNWIIKERSADDVFTLLKLNKEGDKIFQSPVWNTWVSYVTKLDNKNPNQLMFKVLRKHYDDETLARVLATAAEKYETRGIAGILEELQRASWRNSDKTADDVFNILKLNMNRDELFRSNVVNTWISYVKSLEKDPYELLLL